MTPIAIARSGQYVRMRRYLANASRRFNAIQLRHVTSITTMSAGVQPLSRRLPAAFPGFADHLHILCDSRINLNLRTIRDRRPTECGFRFFTRLLALESTSMAVPWPGPLGIHFALQASSAPLHSSQSERGRETPTRAKPDSVV